MIDPWPEYCAGLPMKEKNKLNLQAPWPEVKERAKETNVELTDEDLVYEPGKEEELLKRLSIKMKRTRQDVKAWLESVSSNKGIAS